MRSKPKINQHSKNLIKESRKNPSFVILNNGQNSSAKKDNINKDI